MNDLGDTEPQPTVSFPPPTKPQPKVPVVPPVPPATYRSQPETVQYGNIPPVPGKPVAQNSHGGANKPGLIGSGTGKSQHASVAFSTSPVSHTSQHLVTPDDKKKEKREPVLDVIKLAAGATGATGSMLIGSLFGDFGTLLGAAIGSVTAGVLAAVFEHTSHEAGSRIKPHITKWRTRVTSPDLPSGVIIMAVCAAGLMGGIAVAEQLTGFTVHGIVTHTSDRGSTFTGSSIAPATPKPSPSQLPSYTYVPPAYTVQPSSPPSASASPSPSPSPSATPSASASTSATPTPAPTESQPVSAPVTQAPYTPYTPPDATPSDQPSQPYQGGTFPAQQPNPFPTSVQQLPSYGPGPQQS